MKTIAFTLAAASAAFATSAYAEPFNGPYVGVEVGHDNYEVKAKNVDLSSLGLSGSHGSLNGLSGDGIDGGVYAGYDHSFGNVFAGLEANANISGAKMTASVTDGTNTASVRAKAKESYGISGRLGFKPAEGVGIYGKLGWTNTRFRGSETMNGQTLTDSKREDALSYGGGLEARVAQNTSVRVEYTVSDYGKIGFGPGVKLKNSNVSAGVSYHF